MWAPMKEDGTKLSREQYSVNVLRTDGKWSNPAEGSKPVFINFWAIWCPPCIAEMPAIQELYDEMKGEVDFYILTQDDQEKVKQFMQKGTYTFPVGYPSGPLPAALEHSSIPFTIVLAPDGTVLFKSTGARNWNSDKVKKALRASAQKAE